jgi:hypothetical protein
VAFRLHHTKGFAFYNTEKRFKLPTGKLYLLGAGHIHFEVLFHRRTSWIEVEWLMGIPTVSIMTRSAFCQEKMGSKNGKNGQVFDI